MRRCLCVKSACTKGKAGSCSQECGSGVVFLLLASQGQDVLYNQIQATTQDADNFRMRRLQISPVYCLNATLFATQTQVLLSWLASFAVRSVSCFTCFSSTFFLSSSQEVTMSKFSTSPFSLNSFHLHRHRLK